MCLKGRPAWPMPKETGEVVGKLLKPDSIYKLVGDELFYLFSDADYSDLYSAEGAPAISPVILSIVSIFQFVEKLPDRQAGESLRMRMDWKYALHLPLEYAGFDFSVLSEFRDRLIAHQAEGRAFDRLVQAFRAKGLIKERGKQRTDSLAMLTKVRHLSRVEMVVETLRLAVGAALKTNRAWGEVVIPPAWEERYGERFILGRYRPEEWDDYERTIGDDGVWFLKQVEKEGAPAELQNLPEVRVLQTVWTQQFREEAGQMVYQTITKYDGHVQVQTPHDPQARYSKKRDFAWVGGKLQVTETDDLGYPHLITDIAGTCSNLSDYEALPAIQKRLAQRACLPAQQYVDYGYTSGENLADSQQRGIDLIGPVSQGRTQQSRLVDGITLEQFQIDGENQRARCPAGQQSVRHARAGKAILCFFFSAPVCQACPLRPRCCTGKGGRTLEVRRSYLLLQHARQRQKTDAFQKDYHQHRSGVEGCLSALARGNGLRVCRYIGRPKRHLQALLGGAAANLKRSARWLAGIRPIRHQQKWNLAPQGA